MSDKMRTTSGRRRQDSRAMLRAEMRGSDTSGSWQKNSRSFRDLYNNQSKEELRQREKENFYIDKDAISKEYLPLLNDFASVASSRLWHWKSFPISLPNPITSVVETTGAASKRKTINVNQLFVEPNFNELEAVSKDSKGEPKTLNYQQLESLRRTGEFQVDSEQFAGQKHTWKLSNFLQKGTERSSLTLKKDLAKAFSLVVVTGRDCLVGNTFSLKMAANGWSVGLMSILDIIIGLPSRETNNLDQRLHEERCKYLVCELSSPLPGGLESLAQYVRKMIAKNQREKSGLSTIEDKHPAINFIFQTPQGRNVDLRLHSSEVMAKVKKVVESTLKAKSTGWFPEFREKILGELRLQDLSNEELELEANRLVTSEYLRLVCQSLTSDPRLEDIGPGIGKLVANQLEAGLLVQRCLEDNKRTISKMVDEEERRIRANNPVRSNISDWLERKLKKYEREVIEESEWSSHSAAIKACQMSDLTQHAYFLNRDLYFLRDQLPVLRTELEKNCLSPTQTFTFSTQIWRPSNWVIRKQHKGHLEAIDTVVKGRLEAGEERAFTEASELERPVYLVEKETTVSNSTAYPGWRWVNFVNRTWSWFWNFLFLTIVLIPWCSPFSIRALFYVNTFMPDLEVSPLTGHLIPKTSSSTETLTSRLRRLWRHISKARSEFESMPDTGLLGKSLLRHINIFINYVMKGLVGTICLCVSFPLACLTVSGLSLLVGLVSPLLVLSFSLFYHLTCLLFFDLEIGNLTTSILPNIIWNFLILGILQPALCLLVSVLVCPIVCIVLSLLAVLRKTLRHAWDTVMFQVVIRKRARVPAGDSFVVKRISGPGLASNYFYQIKTEQALAVLESRMELDELDAFKEETARDIKAPLSNYEKFVNDTLRPFSVGLSKANAGPYKQLDKETSDLLDSLNRQVNSRVSQLQLTLLPSIKARIKLTDRELRLAMSRGAAMAQEFYPTHVINRDIQGHKHFWDSRQLRINDWLGLVSSLYSEIFSPDFLTPMQETDNSFKLHVEHWNLTRYANMVLEADFKDDLEVAKVIYSPKGNIQIQSPHIDGSLLDPRSRYNSLLPMSFRPKDKWKIFTRREELLERRLGWPLDLPHPVQVSIIIYNKDSENPIPQEEYQPILRSLEELPQPLSGEYLTGEAKTKGTLNSSFSWTEQEVRRLKERTEVGRREIERESFYDDRSDGMNSQDSMDEMGADLHSLSRSVEDLDNKISSVRNYMRSNSLADSSAPGDNHQQLNSHYGGVRSELCVAGVHQFADDPVPIDGDQLFVGEMAGPCGDYDCSASGAASRSDANIHNDRSGHRLEPSSNHMSAYRHVTRSAGSLGGVRMASAEDIRIDQDTLPYYAKHTAV